MKAVYIEQVGEKQPSRFGELPKPTLSDGMALIRVRAVALNHLDLWVRRGLPGIELNFPHIGGSDIAGEICELSPRHPQLKPGTRVVIDPGVSSYEDEWTRRGEASLSPGYKIIGEHLPGGMAEYVCLPQENLLPLPEDIPYVSAAAAALVATTSWRMLTQVGKVRPGEDVLVVGAGGGVNLISMQLCLSFGLRVCCVTRNKEKAKRVANLGIDKVILADSDAPWHREALAYTNGRGFDYVIDNVGAATFERSLKSLRRGGKLLTVGNTSGAKICFDNRILFAKQLQLLGSTTGSHQDFRDAMQYIWRKRIEPVIDCVKPLSEGPAMLERLAKGEQFGKIVLEP